MYLFICIYVYIIFISSKVFIFFVNKTIWLARSYVWLLSLTTKEMSETKRFYVQSSARIWKKKNFKKKGKEAELGGMSTIRKLKCSELNEVEHRGTESVSTKVRRLILES